MARSENGYGFQRSGLKTGVEIYIFWSEIRSGIGEPGGTPPPRIRTPVPQQKVWFLLRFGLETGINFAHFGLESSMVFEETKEVCERIMNKKD